MSAGADPDPSRPAPAAESEGPPASPPVSVPEPAPERPRGCLGLLGALLGVVVGATYILNPTAGLLELLPDNAPVVGNLDEAAAAALLIFGLRALFTRRR